MAQKPLRISLSFDIISLGLSYPFLHSDWFLFLSVLVSVNCRPGRKHLSHDSSMWQRRPGTSTHTPSQVLVCFCLSDFVCVKHQVTFTSVHYTKLIYFQQLVFQVPSNIYYCVCMYSPVVMWSNCMLMHVWVTNAVSPFPYWTSLVLQNTQ